MPRPLTIMLLFLGVLLLALAAFGRWVDTVLLDEERFRAEAVAALSSDEGRRAVATETWTYLEQTLPPVALLDRDSGIRTIDRFLARPQMASVLVRTAGRIQEAAVSAESQDIVLDPAAEYPLLIEALLGIDGDLVSSFLPLDRPQPVLIDGDDEVPELWRLRGPAARWTWPACVAGALLLTTGFWLGRRRLWTPSVIGLTLLVGAGLLEGALPRVRAEILAPIVDPEVAVITGEIVDRLMEVETPILQQLPGGALARPFQTHHNALDADLYLRIAPELYLKRLLVGGFDRVFEIGKNFRNEGISSIHNPEFTMMELYWAYVDYHEVMELVEQMVAALAAAVLGTQVITVRGREWDLTPPWPRLTVDSLLRENLGLGLAEMREDPEAAREALRAKGVDVERRETFELLVDKALKELVWSTFDRPVFVIDHPVELSPLAKEHRDDDSLVDRFQPVIAGWEIGNAFSELNDPLAQRRRFEQQAANKAIRDAVLFPQLRPEAFPLGT